MVPPRCRGIWLEPKRSFATDRYPPPRTEGKALTNFSRALPPPGSDRAEQVLKDPYNFDFLTLAKDVQEREIERGLLLHLRDFLLDLGRGRRPVSDRA